MPSMFFLSLASVHPRRWAGIWSFYIRRALHILLYTFDSPGNRLYTSTVPANLKGEKGFRHKTVAWDRF